MIGMMALYKRNIILITIGAVIAVVWFSSAFFLSTAPFAQGQNTFSQVSILNLGQGQTLTENYILTFEGTGQLESLELRFINLLVSGNDKLAYAQRDNSTANFWHYELDVYQLGNGSYRLETVAILLDGTSVAGETRQFVVNQTAPTNLEVEVTSPSLNEFLSEAYQFRAQVNQVVENLYFKVTNSFGLLKAYFAGESTGSGLVYEQDYDTLNLDDGEYYVTAEATLAGTTVESDEVHFYLDNQIQTVNSNGSNRDGSTTTTTTTSVFFTHPKAGAIATGRLLVQAKTSRRVDGLYFRIKTKFINAQEFDQNSWQAYVDTAEYADGPLQLIAVAALEGHSFYSEILSLTVKNQIVVTSQTDNTGNNSVNSPSTFFPPSSQNSNTNQPRPVVDNNLTPTSTDNDDKDRVICDNIDAANITCDVYLKNRANLDDSCVRKVIDIDECLRYQEKQNKCQSLGFDNYDLCDSFLTEPRPSRWCNLSEFKNQPVCVNYNREQASRPAETGGDRLKVAELDERCRQQGITSSDKCQRFITYLHLPVICKRQQIVTADDCQEFLKNNYFDLACQQVGIADKAACDDYFVLMSRAKTVCAADNCDQLIKDKFIPQLAARAVLDRSITSQLKGLVNKSFSSTSTQPEPAVAEIIARLPIKYQLGKKLRVVPTEEKIKVSEETLDTVLPAAIVYDNDDDGLPDDIEVRLGTDPENPDSDGDGYLDGQEVANGYDPLRLYERLTKQLAPIEMALVKGEVLEQPLTSGEVSDEVTVEVKNIEPAVAGGQVRGEQLVMSGLGPAFTVLTLYIYSDLPLVATVQVDEYGRWQYTVKDSLVDGEHRVYIAINDETGRIVKKSAGALFFVKEARAVTAEEVVDLQVADSSSILEKYYLAGAAVLVILALLVFIFLRRGFNKKAIGG